MESTFYRIVGESVRNSSLLHYVIALVRHMKKAFFTELRLPQPEVK